MQADKDKEAVVTKGLKENIEVNLKRYEKVIDYVLPFIVVVSLLLIKFAFAFNMDSDPLWSIAVGEWIHTNGTVPLVDHFSWTVAGERWYSNSWLFCWLMYLADQSMGYLGIALIVFIPCLVTGYFLYFTCKRFNNSTFSILVFLFSTSLLLLLSITPRAYIYTFAFVAIVMYLVRFKRNSHYIYLIPLIFLLWANVQNSMSFGIAILFFEALAGTIFHKEKKLWLILGLSVLVTLINPYGIGMWVISLSVPFDTSSQFISEWKAPDFNEWAWLVLYGFLFLIGLLGLSRAKDDINNKRIDRDKIMILFWFCLAFIYSLTAVRALSYVFLLLGPCFSAYATKEEREAFFLKPVTLVFVLLLFVTSMMTALPELPLSFDSRSGKPMYFVDYILETPALNENVEHVFPVGGVNYLLDNPSKKSNLFNSYIYGGYLMINEIDVFIDARFTVFARNNIAEAHSDLVNLKKNPDSIIEEYGIDIFLITAETALSHYLDVHPEWVKQYEDDISVVFTKNVEKAY